MPKLLIVDDEKSIRLTLGEFLRREGHAVVTAEDTETAVGLLESEQFDVVVTDIILPGLCGLELLRRIKEAAPEVPVIVMTGEPSIETAAEAVRSGALDYLAKPIGKHAVLRAVNHALDVKLLAETRSRLEELNRQQQEILQRQVEERTRSLEENRRFLSDLVENSATVIFAKDRLGRYELVNREWENATGVSREVAVGRTDAELFPPAMAEAFARTDEEVFATSRAREEEVVLSTGAGQRTYLMNHFPVMDPGGQIRAVCAIGTDITERRRMEAALREGEAQLRRAQKVGQMGSWSVDLRTSVVRWSEETYRMFGVEPGSPMTRQSFLDRVEPRDVPSLNLAWEEALRGGAYEVEHRILVGGEVRWVRERAEVEFDERRVAVGAIGVVQDITERKDVEAQFLRSQRVECLGALASGIAHDLNNLLTPILFGAANLRAGLTNTEDLETLELIDRCARRGADVIRHLLSFSRGRQGERVPIQPRHLLEEVSGIVEQTFPKLIRVKCTAPKDLHWVQGEATELHQVLMNLCVNARDAMPDGGELRLEAENRDVHPHGPESGTESVPAGPYVRLSVIDTGCGMDPETRLRIFEPFFTTKEAEGGTGLGLSTVRGIVRAHGGWVLVASEPGRGSRFDVYLPAISDGTTVAGGGDPRAPLSGNGEQVLVVDDEAPIRAVLSSLLQRFGYAVRTAANGQDAVTGLESSSVTVDLVLTDLEMPVMDGIGLIRWLHAHRPQIKILALTGTAEPRISEAEMRSLGVERVIRKPCESRVLAAVVRETLHPGKGSAAAAGTGTGKGAGAASGTGAGANP